MPRDLLLVLCFVTTWICVVSAIEGNETVVSPVNTTSSDNNTVNTNITRRSGDLPLSVDLITEQLQASTKEENKNVDNNVTEPLIARSSFMPSDELTGFETDVPCDNAQFLVKILTVLLPLLREEVPKSTRTNYIAYILRDLLKSSPEAAQDQEVMYKINDLLLTLEKYQDRTLYGGNNDHNALRQLFAPAVPDAKSKIVLKYDIPSLANPDCTAELLKIIKVVQQAITRIVNNPLCKSQQILETPLGFDIDAVLSNSALYPYYNKGISEVSTLIPDVVTSELTPKPYKFIDINVPNKVDVINTKPLYPNVIDDIDVKYQPDIYEVLPSGQNKPLLPLYPYDEPLYVPAEYPKDQDHYNSPYKYDTAPNFLPNPNNGIFKPVDIPNQIKISPLDIVDHSYSTPSVFDFDLPIFHTFEDGVPRPKKPTYRPKPSLLPFEEHDHPYINPFGEIIIDEKKPSLYQPDIIDDFPVTPSQSIDFYADDDSTEFPFVINRPQDLVNKPQEYDITNLEYNTHPQERPRDLPSNYDSAPPIYYTDILGVPELPINSGKPINSYTIIDDSLTREPIRPNPYKPYVPNVTTQKILPFDVISDGPGEITLEPEVIPLPENKNIYIPENPYRIKEYIKDYYPYNSNIKESPKYLFPKEYVNDDLDSLLPKIINVNEEVPMATPKPFKEVWPIIPINDDRYVIQDDTVPSNVILTPDFENVTPNIEIDKIDFNRPELWDINVSPQPNLIPDYKILPIIRENINVMELKIPKEYMNYEIRNLIKQLTDLLDAEQITIEEYVNIINHYQILLESVKRLNISDAIMKDLFLSITNLDKLDLLTRKPQAIELTYLVKRPEPLIYQPYYYVKYRLPYISFLNNVQRLLAANPYLKRDPGKLYKALISISRLIEASPDLEKYGKDDILRITFDKGTLVGARLVKGFDSDMYGLLNRLQNINNDFSVEDIYHLIEKLDSQLKNTPQDLIYEDNSNPILSINSEPEILITKVKKQPIVQKITRITTNKAGTNKILSDILNNVDVLRSAYNLSEGNLNSSQDPDLNFNASIPLIGRTKYPYELKEMSSHIPLVNQFDSINYEAKKYPVDEYLKMFKDANYGSKYDKTINGIKNNANLDWNGSHLNPSLYDTKPILTDQIRWRDEPPKYDVLKGFRSKGLDYNSVPGKSTQNYPKPLNEFQKNIYSKELNSKPNPYDFKPVLTDQSKLWKGSTSTSDALKDLDYLSTPNKGAHNYPRILNGQNTGFDQTWKEIFPSSVAINDQSKWLDGTSTYDALKQYNLKENKMVPAAGISSMNDPFLKSDSTFVGSKTRLNEELDPIIAAKFLEASINADETNKSTKNINIEPTPQHASVTTTETSKNTDTSIPNLIQHSKTYVNGVPIEHSKSYSIEKVTNGKQFDTPLTDPVKYNVEHSQSLIDYNPYVANYNYNINPSLDKKSNSKGGLTQNAAFKSPQTSTNVDSFAYGSAMNSGQPLIKNSVQAFGASNGFNGNSQTPPYFSSNPFITNQIYPTNSLDNLGLYNQLLAKNNIMNAGHQYMIHQRWPLFNQLSTVGRPRILGRPFLG